MADSTTQSPSLQSLEGATFQLRPQTSYQSVRRTKTTQYIHVTMDNAVLTDCTVSNMHVLQSILRQHDACSRLMISRNGSSVLLPPILVMIGRRNTVSISCSVKPTPVNSIGQTWVIPASLVRQALSTFGQTRHSEPLVRPALSTIGQTGTHAPVWVRHSTIMSLSSTSQC